MPKLRGSVAQCCTAAYDLDATLGKLERLARVAKDRDQSRLLVFPECFVGGYPRGEDFGAVVGSRSAEGRARFATYYNGSIIVPGPATDRISRVSAELDLFLVVGVLERDTASSTLYCTALFVAPSAGVVAKHRKLMPTASERLCWGFGDGGPANLPVVEHDFEGTTAKVAATICWENYMPLLRFHLYQQGVQIWCAPTVDSRDTWQASMRHIAAEGRVFVLSACQFSQQKDFPPDHPVVPSGHGTSDGKRDADAVMVGGGSLIVGPLGNVLAGPLADGEDVLTAELDLDAIAGGKFDLDVTGHYSRSDIFQLHIRH